MVTPEMLAAIVAQHHLKGGHSIHFLDHWARVLENGRCLAANSPARLDVIELFSVFHDSGRLDDGTDPGHGARGAKIAAGMRGHFFEIDQPGMDLLVYACENHTRGKTDADLTVQICWDSDRLDLGRAGIVPSPGRLCTPAAREAKMIAWAHDRSIRHFFPDAVRAEWGLAGGD